MSTETTAERDGAMRAAEYVLHLMPSADRKDFEATIAWDPEVRAEVVFWNEHFAALADEVVPVTPPATLKRTIQAELFADIGNTSSLTSKLRLWRTAAIGMAAVAAAAAFMAFLPMFTTPGGGPGTQIGGGAIHTADIAAQDASLRVIAVYQADTGELKLNRTAGAAPSQRDLELWAIIGDDAPVSLGVLPAGQQVVISVPEKLRGDFQMATLAISEEPVGGSPTGAPTGAVLAAGALATF